jgi:hypothetical protein
MDLTEKKKKLLEMKKKYLALKHNIPNDIRNTIDSKEIIQGERSLEAQLPPNLKRETTDFDVYSHTPKESAEETEEFLDKEFGGDYFKVVKAQHKGTYKVKSNIDDETYADYSKTPKKAPHIKIGDTKYTTLKFELYKALRTLKQKKYAYRHKQEKNKVGRIQAYFKSRWF